MQGIQGVHTEESSKVVRKLSNSPKSLFRSIEKKFQEQLNVLLTAKKDSHSNTCVRLCHCTGNHSVGCGCITAECIAKEHKHFTSILVESQEEFVTLLDSLARHARDEHE